MLIGKFTRSLEHLNVDINQPLAMALSGGGDSMALLSLCRKAEAGRPLHALIVDHGLRPESYSEAQTVADWARALGAQPHILKWKGCKPETGIQEKARQARYDLIGNWCRANGITTLLVGHTQDDQAETLLMRYDRATDWRGAAGMAERVYAPLWPQLAEITLVRPLLGMPRQHLRAYNRAGKLNWIEDPSNENRDFTRIRARDYLQGRTQLKHDLLRTAETLSEGLERERILFGHFYAGHVRCDKWGLLQLEMVPPPMLLKHLLRAASGTGGPIEMAKLRGLARQMGRADFSGATLAGAHVIRHRGRLIMGPDPARFKGRHNRSALGAIKWPVHEKRVWDGRYLISCHHNGITVRPLMGYMARLSKPQKAQLGNIPPVFRGSLPLILNESQNVYGCPGVALHPDIDMDCLVPVRLAALLKPVNRH